MHKHNGLTWLGIVAVCLLLSACAGQLVCQPEEVAVVPVEPQDEPRQPDVITPPPQPPAEDFIPNPAGPGKIAVVDGNPITAQAGFAFDDASLSPEARAVLSRHAQLLVENRGQRVLVEGHCDERGTREYNLALGERRANAVVDFFLANGVRASQIDSRSFGEERPIDAGSSEAAWAKNRRVELKYY